jgi:hypothetical protein
MSENFALYSATLDHLPTDQIPHLVPEREPRRETTERGLTYTWAWPDLRIICSEMPDNEMAEHLRGLRAFVERKRAGVLSGRVDTLVEFVSRVTLVVGVELQPRRDAGGRAQDFIGKLSFGMQPLMFFENALYDQDSRLLLGPDGSIDPDACLRAVQ